MVLALTSAPFFCPGKNRGLYFRIGDTWCRHFVDVPTRPTRPQSSATAACNAFHSKMLQFKPIPKFNEMPQNPMKSPKKMPQKSTRLTRPQSSATAACNAFHSNSLHPTTIYLFAFSLFLLLSTKTPPTAIHGFMARKELLGLHAARLQGATKY